MHCVNQNRREVGRTCRNCANAETDYCVICNDHDFHRTKEEKAYENWMCELLCGGVEDDM